MSDLPKRGRGRPPVLSCRILGYLACWQSASYSSIVEELDALGHGEGATQTALRRMVTKGLVHRMSYGVYAISTWGHRYLAKHGEVCDV